MMVAALASLKCSEEFQAMAFLSICVKMHTFVKNTEFLIQIRIQIEVSVETPSVRVITCTILVRSCNKNRGVTSSV